jgi:tRNA nucleotidyltransferase/poly(A) polymerase
MADIEVEETQQVDIPEDGDQKSSSASQTRMLITHFEENPILWDKRLKDSANKQKTKKAMAPLIGRFEMTLPQRNPKEIKSRWHGLRSSLLRNMKKKKVDPDCEIKWAFWKDLEFIRLSLEMEEGNEDHVECSNEETGKFLLSHQFPVYVS